MRMDWPLPIRQMNSLLLHLQRFIVPCLVLLLLTLPLWLHSAHTVGALNTDSIVRPMLMAGMGGSQSADAPSSVHCAVHCAPQLLLPTLLLHALLVPLSSSSFPAYARFHVRLGSAPPLPPPRAR